VGHPTQRATSSPMDAQAHTFCKSRSSTPCFVPFRHQNLWHVAPYKVFGGKLDSVYGRVSNHTTSELVEALTDSDWAGDQSSCSSRRRHSVSSAMISVLERG
jgi:hypothetical protein